MESDKDLVAVELEPEKKGLVLKHREYTVTSTVSIHISNKRIYLTKRNFKI